MKQYNNYYILKNLGAQIVKFKGMNEDILNNMYCIALFVGFPNKFIYFPITILNKDNKYFINPKITSDSKNSELYDIISSSNSENGVIYNIINYDLLTKTPNKFTKDTDFFLSKCIVDYINTNQYKNIKLANDTWVPNYWRNSNEINSEYFEELNDISINDLEWCNYQNCLIKYELSEDDINNFRVTFANKLLELFDDNENILSDKNNSDYNFTKYKLALLYYTNKDLNTDKTYLTLQQVLRNFPKTNNSSCPICNQTNIPIINVQQTDCLSQYKSGMQNIIIEMFSNIDFYCQFFYKGNKINIELCNYLIKLLDAIDSKINVISSNNSNHCNCPVVDFTSNNQCSEKNTLDHFKILLTWIKNDELKNHINEAKIYGNEFGKIFQTLIF